jgi:amino acid transporter
MATCMQIVMFVLAGLSLMVIYKPWRSYLAYRYRHDQPAEHSAIKMSMAAFVIALCALQFFVIEPLDGPRVSYADMHQQY